MAGKIAACLPFCSIFCFFSLLLIFFFFLYFFRWGLSFGRVSLENRSERARGEHVLFLALTHTHFSGQLPKKQGKTLETFSGVKPHNFLARIFLSVHGVHSILVCATLASLSVAASCDLRTREQSSTLSFRNGLQLSPETTTGSTGSTF